MREFTKSAISYALSSSLFSLQEMATFLTPQGWLQTGRTAKSVNSVTKATAEQMGAIAGSTFRVADNLQRGSVDLMFSLFTLGLLDQSAGARSGNAPGASNLGGQALNFLCQGFEALGQTAGSVGQAMGGGCGSCSSADTGWGPVRPAAGGRKSD